MNTESLVHLFLPTTLAMIMLAMGLGLTISDFKSLAEKPRAAITGLTCQMVLLPICGFGVAWLFGLRSELAVGLVVLTACPGGAHSNLFTNLARGDTALSVTMTAVSGVLTVVTIPLIASGALQAFATGESDLSLPMGETVTKVFVLMALPIATGMALRAWSEKYARLMEKIVKSIAVFLLVVLIAGAVGRQASRLGELVHEVGAAVVALNVGTMLLGFVVTRSLALPGRQTIAIVMEVGIQNSALAVGLTMSFFGADYAVPAIVYSLFVYLTGFLIVLIGRTIYPEP
ncbi:MAG: bile acid:sodium symporter family protein [Deltaproteobacteria bacterium]|nr:bile acid:sodium symporter family protein [Deltaproteobacteria bacterium]MBT6432759.1 bile acid:sodium symporter family protein [Deltaproteobacteria bacterium]